MRKLALLACLVVRSVHSEFAAVNGLKMYYEVHGAIVQDRPNWLNPVLLDFLDQK